MLRKAELHYNWRAGRTPMKHAIIALTGLLTVTAAGAADAPAAIPHLESRGHAKQLIVDGRPWIMPVSYTHLDVYKRQRRHRAPPRCP